MCAKKLYRSTNDSVLGGVCGGLGTYLDIDPIVIRLIWVVFSLVYGCGLLLYIIAFLIIPEEPKYNKDDKQVDVEIVD